MNKLIQILVLGVSLLGIAHATPETPYSYHVARTFKLGGDGFWDYLTLDGVANRLFIGRSDRIMVVDPANGKLIGTVHGLVRAHGVALDSASGHGFATSGGDAMVVMFDLNTLKVIGKTKVNNDDDAFTLEPATTADYEIQGNGAFAIENRKFE